MKKYIPPNITAYFAERSAFPAAVLAAAAGGVAAGISAGFLAGKRDIFKGKYNSLPTMRDYAGGMTATA